jgi:NAD dependent epimerase/dehydratase
MQEETRMELDGKTVFVTGADGFIGSHLVEALVTRSLKVRALVYYNSLGSFGWLDSLPPEVLSQVEVVAGDVRDPHLLETLTKDADVIFHLAALIGIPFSYTAPDLYVQTNIQGTLNLLQAARKWGRAKFIHTSTSEIYGSAQFVPITEKHPVSPQSPYAATKAAADQMALSFYYSFEVPVSVVRPFNTFGPRQSTRAIIPALVLQMLGDEGVIRVGATTPTRDFTYVKDTVEGFVAAAVSDRSIGETIQLGSNFELSIGELISLIGESLGVQPKIVTEEVRMRPEKSEVLRLWADNTRAREILGWNPNFGGKDGFRKALEMTIDWFRQPRNREGYKRLYAV